MHNNNIVHLFRTDNLLELKRGIDEHLNITPYSEKFEFLDQIEFNIIPEFYISIETKTQISTSRLSLPMDDRKIAIAKQKIKFLEKYVSDKRKYFQNRKSLTETKIDIITALLWDSNFVLKLVEEQIRWRDYKKYIIASNRELFDNVKLHSYLTTLNEATPFLKNQIRDILVRIRKIIDFDNGILQEILNETNKKGISNKIDFGGNSFYWLAYNYQCIIVEETQKRYINLESEENRYYFQSNYTNNTFDSNDFAHKGNGIQQTLTSFLNINTIEDLNIFLNSSKSSSEKIDYLHRMEDDLKVEIVNRLENPEIFEKINKENQKPIPEKWSALLYLIYLAIDNELPPQNVLGQIKKSEVQKIAKDRGYKNGQYFYTAVRDTNLDKPNAIANSYHKDWKEKIIMFSNNDAKVIAFLKEKYDQDSLR